MQSDNYQLVDSFSEKLEWPVRQAVQIILCSGIKKPKAEWFKERLCQFAIPPEGGL
jgi:hypothetical protein